MIVPAGGLPTFPARVIRVHPDTAGHISTIHSRFKTSWSRVWPRPLPIGFGQEINQLRRVFAGKHDVGIIKEVHRRHLAVVSFMEMIGIP